MAETTRDLPAPGTLEPCTAPEILRRIGSGEVTSEALSVDDRRACVAYLTTEGYSASEIAQLMNLSERTVTRDRAAVRKLDAIVPDLYLGDELLGEYHRLTLGSIQRLIRLARDEATPPYARLWAEDAISRCYQRLIDIAHRLRYVDTGCGRLKHQRAVDPDEKQRTDELDAIHREALRKPVW